MTAHVDTSRTASAKRTAAVGVAVVVLTPALGVAVAAAALPLFAVAGVVLVASLGGSSLLARAAGSGGRRPLPEPNRAERDEPRQGAEAHADQGARQHVEREVHAQVDARQRDGGGQRENPGPQPGAQD